MFQDLPEEVLHARSGPGLSPGSPAACGEAAGHGLDPVILGRRALRQDEVDDVRGLLLDHANAQAGDGDALAAVAERVALACLGDNHLWQDLQLASRGELSELMRHWFPALVARNHADMKWKKFLYKQLCEREALFICKAPSCEVCTDRPLCFGPETP
jgi:nitrogen fixation protein NifQ